ncbi:hypothetical protein NUW54_g12128 [Trametes sanguinea]|uniref:Uncharacterized protein n=1 Tax=Trametes sanguinea TaxID=158606 RepID=A0ACC1N1D2_9APHY|nr:hypothetical protein NUW54_g12128 [Trametes sanguinea]
MERNVRSMAQASRAWAHCSSSGIEIGWHCWFYLSVWVLTKISREVLTSDNAEKGALYSESAKPRLARLEARKGERDRVPTWLYRLWDQRMQLTTRRATKTSLGVPDHIMVEGKDGELRAVCA